MKKTIYLIALILLIINDLSAQKKFEKVFSLSNAKEIFLNFKYASNIQVKYWDKNEIQVNALVNVNDNQNNDNFELESQSLDNQLNIQSIIKDLKGIAKKSNSTSQKDDCCNNYYGNHGYWDGDNKVYVSTGKHIQIDIDYEVFIPRKANLKVKTIAGNIKAEYERGKFLAESISGQIDLSIAENQKNTFKLKTISGDVYSNIKLDYPSEKDEDGLPRIGGGYGTDVTAKLNGGGDEIYLKSISGDIFLRKK